MVNRLQPTVTIGGLVIPCDELGGTPALLGLAGLTIDWGRDDLYARTEPSTIRLSLIDATGAWSAATARYGERLEVFIPDQDRVLFAGTITETRIRRTDWPDDASDSGEAGIAWQTTIDAVDILADLDRDPVRGTGLLYPEPAIIAGGARATNSTIATVTNNLRRELTNAYVSGLTGPSNFDLPSNWQMAVPTVNNVPSWLELLYEMWSAIPFSTVAYNPNADAIYCGTPVDATFIKIGLVWSATADTITLEALRSSGSVPVNIDACRLEVDAIELSSTIQSAITTVKIPHPFLRWEYAEMLGNRWFFPGSDWRDTEDTFTLAGSFRTARTVSVPSRIIPNPPSQPANIEPGGIIPDLPDRPTGTPFPTIGANWVAAVAAVNGQMTPPDTTYRTELWPASTIIESTLLRTQPSLQPVFIVGTATAGIANVPAILQLIGGQHVWNGTGWEIQSRWAPTPFGLEGSPVAINQLVTIPEPGFDDYDPGIRLIDLGTVTRGIT